MTYRMKRASHTPLAPATASVLHGVLNARRATTAAVNIAIGPASGARQRSGTRNTRSATIGRIAKAQCRTSTGTCAVVCIRVRCPGAPCGLLTERVAGGRWTSQSAAGSLSGRPSGVAFAPYTPLDLADAGDASRMSVYRHLPAISNVSYDSMTG